ncbi:twitching motility protein PilT [Pseudomonas oryzihabitans]|nr:twitching motility protein PilT [Pseudomonas psychrotolerans]
MSIITRANFVDLYLGEDFADVKDLEGSGHRRVPAPPAWAEALNALRQRCREHFREHQDPEFSLIEDGIVLRVTLIRDSFSNDVFVIRRSDAQIRPFDLLGLPESVASALLDDKVRGLVLFSGEMKSGKTSSAASLISARLQACGGTALAIEDPSETNLNGLHGEGRCIQMQVSLRSGGYEEALVRALRTGADMLLIGEIRDGPTAALTVQAAINGHFVAATLHAGGPAQAVERLLALASPALNNVNAPAVLAQGLTAVIGQALLSQGERKVLKVRSLLLTGHDAAGIREKIRNGQIAQLKHDIDAQSKRERLA